MKILCLLGGLFVFFSFECLAQKPLHKKMRDPFFLPVAQKNEKRALGIFLRGVIKVGKKIGALIDYDNQQKVVFKGDKIGGYLIRSISMETMTLKKGKKEIILRLKKRDRN